MTPKEHSSGNTRRLGRISKRGDVYVRTLLTHGARAVLARAQQMQGRADLEPTADLGTSIGKPCRSQQGDLRLG